MKNSNKIAISSGAALNIGISSCLLGENVRYDGSNKYASHIVSGLGHYVNFIPVCPETGIGLGVPRPPLKLVELDGRVSAVGADNPVIDATQSLADFGRKQATLLTTVSGYIFKSRSPSCGLTDTPITTGGEEKSGPGLYTRQIITAMPLLPVTDEVSLRFEKSVCNFLEQAFAYSRWQLLLDKPLSAVRLHRFHSLHTIELERHYADYAREFADFLLSIKDPVPKATTQSYLEKFMTILQLPAAVELQTEELFEIHTRLAAALEIYTD